MNTLKEIFNYIKSFGIFLLLTIVLIAVCLGIALLITGLVAITPITLVWILFIGFWVFMIGFTVRGIKRDLFGK